MLWSRFCCDAIEERLLEHCWTTDWPTLKGTDCIKPSSVISFYFFPRRLLLPGLKLRSSSQSFSPLRLSLSSFRYQQLWPGYFLQALWAIFGGRETHLLPGVSLLSISIPLSLLAHLSPYFFLTSVLLFIRSLLSFLFLQCLFPPALATFIFLSHSVPFLCSPFCPTFLSLQPTDARFSHLISA